MQSNDNMSDLKDIYSSVDAEKQERRRDNRALRILDMAKHHWDNLDGK